MIYFFFLTDVDECVNGFHTCNHNCNNTIGSYECFCDDGFMLDQTDTNCIGMQMSLYNCIFI